MTVDNKRATALSPQVRTLRPGRTTQLAPHSLSYAGVKRLRPIPNAFPREGRRTRPDPGPHDAVRPQRRPDDSRDGKAAPDSKDLDARLLKTAGICILAAVMTILDTTVVNVAQRTFVEQFHSTEAVVAWTMTGYTLALAAVIPLAGWAADRFGTKRLFVGSVALFSFGSLLCALATTIGSLIAFRVFQGLGGGMVMPLVFTILTREAGPARLGRVTSLLGIPMLLAPVSGPILGGWLIGYHSWPWIFWINLPIGMVTIVLAAKVFDKDKPQKSESIDLPGMMLICPGLATFFYALSVLPEHDNITKPRLWLAAVIGVALIGGFVWHALHRTAHPLVDLRLFGSRTVTASNAAMLMFGAAFFGAVLLLPSYFQQVFGYSPLQAGLRVIPEGLGAMLTMPIAGPITDRHGPRGVVLAGLMLMCTGMGAFCTGVWHHACYFPTLSVGLLIFGAGMGCVMLPLSAAAVQTLDQSQVARGSTLINVSQRVGAAIGAAALAVVLTNLLAHNSNVAAANLLAESENQTRGPLDPALIPAAAQSPGFHDRLVSDLSHAYGLVFLIVYGVVALTCLPAALLTSRPAVARNSRVRRSPSERNAAKATTPSLHFPADEKAKSPARADNPNLAAPLPRQGFPLLPRRHRV
jgi:MFS transporter, DHA2 family, multidrug resistance protein